MTFRYTYLPTLVYESSQTFSLGEKTSDNVRRLLVLKKEEKPTAEAVLRPLKELKTYQHESKYSGRCNDSLIWTYSRGCRRRGCQNMLVSKKINKNMLQGSSFQNESTQKRRWIPQISLQPNWRHSKCARRKVSELAIFYI